MKKILYLIVAIMLLMPIRVFAEVGINTPINSFTTEAACLAELSQNSSSTTANATTGFYLTCKKVSCSGGYVLHQDLKPLNTNVSCANGNQYPYTTISASAASGTGINVGDVCSVNSGDTNYVETFYATERQHFNCAQVANGDTYSTTDNQNNNNNNNSSKDNDGTKNPETGIETYYVVLGTTVLILSLGLYIVNKKNLFKKI